MATQKILKTFDRETIVRFYRDWYRPESMAVIAVGDFDPKKVVKRIKQEFGGRGNPTAKREPPDTTVPDHEETLSSIVVDPELSGTRVSISYKFDAPDRGTVGDYRDSLVKGLFNGMLNARLGELQQQVDPPFLAAGSSESGLSQERSIYTLSVSVAKGEVIGGLTALLAEARRAAVWGFNESELERGKESMLRYYERLLKERDKSYSSGFAAEYIRNFLQDESIPGIEFEARIAEQFVPDISLEEVNAAAQRFLGSSRNRVVLFTGPEDEDVVPPQERELLAVFDEVAQAELEPWSDRMKEGPLVPELPAPGSVTERTEDPKLGVTRLELSNGVEVILKPTDFQNDQILFSSFSPGGHSLVDDEDHVSALIAPALVSLSGYGAFDRIELRKKLTGKAVSVSPVISEGAEALTGAGSLDDLETLFQLLYLAGTEPRCSEEALASYRKRMAGALENRLKSPEAVFGEEIQRVLTQEHFRRRPFTEELLEEIELEAACRIYRERFADFSDFTFFFVGSFQEEQLIPYLERYVASLPSIGRDEEYRDVGVRLPEGRVVRRVEAGLEPKARFRFLFHGPFEQSVNERFNLEAMRHLLQTRLRERLREELGGTYGVGVGSSTSFEPVEEYSISVSFSCDPEKLELLREAMLEEIARLQNEPPSPEEVRTIREIKRRERETSLRSDDFWLGALQFYFTHEDEDPLSILTYQERVEALDATAIHQAAKRYLSTDNQIEFVLLPGEQVSSEAAQPAE